MEPDSPPFQLSGGKLSQEAHRSPWVFSVPQHSSEGRTFPRVLSIHILGFFGMCIDILHIKFSSIVGVFTGLN